MQRVAPVYPSLKGHGRSILVKVQHIRDNDEREDVKNAAKMYAASLERQIDSLKEGGGNVETNAEPAAAAAKPASDKASKRASVVATPTAAADKEPEPVKSDKASRRAAAAADKEKEKEKAQEKEAEPVKAAEPVKVSKRASSSALVAPDATPKAATPVVIKLADPPAPKADAAPAKASKVCD